MSKILSLFFFLSSFLSVAQNTPQLNSNGYNKFYYANGVVSSEGVLRDGKPDGYWKTYSTKGVIKSEGNRTDYQLDSVWKFYNEAGILAFEFKYKKGKKNGSKNTFDVMTGQIVSSENYITDVKEGNSFYYFKTKESNLNTKPIVKNSIPYIAGKMHGKAYEYTIDSTIITITQYNKGSIVKVESINRKDAKGLKQGVWKLFYPTGTINRLVDYSDDRIHGYLKEYSSNGSLINTTKYNHGVLETDVPELVKLDLETKYYQGGAKFSTGTFKEGVAEGAHRKYAVDGRITETKIYSNGVVVSEGILDSAGRFQGLWKEYFSNGIIKSKGKYSNSTKIGEWVYYFQDGKIEQKGSYDRKGNTQGVWRWYYLCHAPCESDAGNLLREENYKNNMLEGSMIEYSDSGTVITKGEFLENEKEGFWMLELTDYKAEGSYKSGKRSGEWKHFYITNNQIRFTGSFIDGEPDGKQVFYYPNGNVKKTGSYAGGLKDGEWKYYDKSGYLFLTILYENNIEIRFDRVKVVPETEQ